jgi:hypothetical protein
MLEHPELALLWFQKEVVFSQLIQDMMYFATMEFQVVSCVDENVVHVDGDPSFSQFFYEDCIHHGLECCG